MARDIQTFDIQCSIGGNATAPLSQTFTIPDRIIREVEFMIPNGINGQVHFRLAVNGTPVVPSNNFAYITGNDEVIRWPVEGLPEATAWQLQWFNLGNYPHTLQIRLLMDLPQLPVAYGGQPLPLIGMTG